MKTFIQSTLSTLVAALLIATPAHGQLLVYEGFDYPPGALLGNGGTGWAGPWTEVQAGHTVSSPGLGYRRQSLELITTGNSVLSAPVSGSSPNSSRNLAAPLGADGTTLYISFIAQINSSFGGLLLFNTNQLRMHMGAIINRLLGVSVGSTSVTTTNNSVNTNTFLVYRLAFTGSTVTVRMYINPPLFVEPTVSVIGSTNFPAFTFNRVVLYAPGPTPADRFDEIRIGSTYADVVPYRGPSQPATYTVSNTNDSGAGSLRQAIHDANTNLAPDRVVFAIPGEGPHTIAPLTPLPTITDPLVIDGYTQSGSQTNSLTNGNNAVIRIRLDGVNAGAGADGLRFTSQSNVVRGLAIGRFAGAGIELDGSRNSRVQGCYLGLDVPPGATGGLAAASGSPPCNFGNGVGLFLTNASRTTCGGAASGDALICSGNSLHGIFLSGTSCASNRVENVSVGTDASGTQACPNGIGIGVKSGAKDNDFLRIVVAGNTGAGMDIGSQTFGGFLNVVSSGLGTDLTGTLDLPNGGLAASCNRAFTYACFTDTKFNYGDAGGLDSTYGNAAVNNSTFIGDPGKAIITEPDVPASIIFTATPVPEGTRYTVDASHYPANPGETSQIKLQFYWRQAVNRILNPFASFIINASTGTTTRAEVLYTGSLPPEAREVYVNATQITRFGGVVEAPCGRSFGLSAPYSTVPLWADLAISSSISGCETQTVTLVVTNMGPNNASEVVVHTELPQRYLAIQIVTSQGACSRRLDGGVRCDLGALDVGASATISIETASPTPTPRQSYWSAVSATHPLDPNPTNDEVIDETEILADLRVGTTPNTLALAPGEQAVITLQVDNLGPCTARFVKCELEFEFPLRIISVIPFLSVIPSQSGKCRVSDSGLGLSCEWPSLASGSQATVSVVCTAVEPFQHQYISAKFTALKPRDPNLWNNTDGVFLSGTERDGIQFLPGGDGTLDLNWEGDGKLQTASNVNPPTIIWYDVPTTRTNSYTVRTTNGQAFYRIEWNPPPPRPLPWLTLHQNDLKLDGNVTSNSAWGTADVTFLGSTNPFYLNLRIGTNWPVRNLPIISALGEDKPQTLSVNFKLTETGTEVTNVESGFSFTTNIIVTPPPTTEYRIVWRRNVEIYSGIQGTSLVYRDPTDLVGGPVQSWRAGKPVFPNEEQGWFECTPAAVANSLNYLNTVFALGIDPAELTVERMKVATGWTTNGPVSAADPSGGWVTEKIVYMSLHNLPIVTERTTDPSRVMMALEQCCDVEIEMAGHVAAIVAMADVGNGNYALTLSHDNHQALPGLPLGNGGTRLEPILFDSNTGLLYGTFWSSRFITFVIECPADQ